MGVSLKVWASTDGQRVLQGLARRGLKVRILIMSPSNPGLGAMINAQLPTESLQAVKEQTRRMEMYFRNFIKDNSYGTFQVRTINEGIPHFQLMITDQTALVVQYMFCRGTEDSPLQQFPVGTDLYGAFRQEFEDLWTMNDLTQVSYTNANLADSSAEQVKPDNPAAAFEPAKSQPQD
jgi:hypothetical protein